MATQGAPEVAAPDAAAEDEAVRAPDTVAALSPADRLDGHSLLLFDGVCNFCHGAVRFIIARDPDAHFRFASLQSDYGRAVVREHGLPEDLDSMVLVEPGGRVSRRSTGALRVATKLRTPWPLFGVLLVVPGLLRDPLYEILARNRYRWFGRKDSCPLPDPHLADRFLG